VQTQNVETFPGYPGHLITVTLYEEDPHQQFHFIDTTLQTERLTSADNNHQEITIDLTNKTSPTFVSVRVRIDTEVPPGLYDDFVVTRLLNKSQNFYIRGVARIPRLRLRQVAACERRRVLLLAQNTWRAISRVTPARRGQSRDNYAAVPRGPVPWLSEKRWVYLRPYLTAHRLSNTTPHLRHTYRVTPRHGLRLGRGRWSAPFAVAGKACLIEHRGRIMSGPGSGRA
jgi:hypothetical protein